MASAGYALEHFYYGQFTRQGKPEGELRLLAASPGMKPEQIAEMVQLALIPPLVGSPQGSWALVRGRNVPFILVRSTVRDSGAAVLHFILIPVDVLRAMGGNLKAIADLFNNPLPVNIGYAETVQPLVLMQAAPPSPEEQADSMLALMDCVHNHINLIESLLAAIIQGIQIVVRNAPTDMKRRVDFIEGLLALLPPPARFGVTFATHTLPSTRIDAQIRFYSGNNLPVDNAVVYDWQEGKLGGTPTTDEYSHFIISQLRLDVEMVLQATGALTPVAAWRIKRGDTLADSLRYASYRLKVDDAVQNNLPVAVEDVARVLAEDPTLSEALRAQYVRHVLAFELALEDTEYVEPLAPMLASQPNLTMSVMVLLNEALASSKATLVYEMLVRWLTNPLGPGGMAWTDVLQRAALARHENLVLHEDTDGVRRFLNELHQASLQLELGQVIPRMIETSLPLVGLDPKLADNLFILAADYLQPEPFLKLMRNPALLGQLPESLSKLAPYLTGEEKGAAPPGLLVKVSSAFGDDAAPLILIRLAEAALNAQRYDLLDTQALTGLAKTAASPYAAPYESVFRNVVRYLSSDENLTLLDENGQRSLLQILLARRAFPELALELTRQARLYPDSKMADFAVMVRRLFTDTPLGMDEVPEVLRTLSTQSIKPLPLAMAHLGALKRSSWAPSLEQIANNATNILAANPAIIDAVPPASLLELLDFHVTRRDINGSIRVAGLLPYMTATKGEGGVTMMVQMFKSLSWDRKTRIAALEVLRRYIRTVDLAYARQAIAQLGQALGDDVRAALEATYVFRLLLNGRDLSTYAKMVHVTAEFLHDTTMAYVDRRLYPGGKVLLGDLASLGGGLGDDDRKAIARQVLLVGSAIVALGKQQRPNRPRDLDAYLDQLVAGETAPQIPLDLMRLIGGYFARGKRLIMQWERPLSLHPLGDRAAPALLRDMKAVNAVLRAALKVFDDGAIALKADALRGEIDSLWEEIPLPERRRLVRDLALDLQRIPELVTYITEHGDARVLDENSGAGRRMDTNRHQPQSTLELYRFIHGYFKVRVRQKPDDKKP